AYLLAPALEGAALSDFHMVAIAAPVLMTALYFLETGRWRVSLALLAFAALCREDAAVTVAWLALLLALRRRWTGRPDAPPRAFWLMFLGTAAWAALCFLVIAPFFNGQGSVFWAR